MYIWREWDLYLMSCIFTTFGYKAGYIIAEEGNPPTLESYGQMWLVNEQRMSLFPRLFSQSSQANEFRGGTRDHEATEAVKVAWWLCYACKFDCAVRCIIMQSLWFKWMLPKKLLMYSLIFDNFLNKNHNAVALMKTDFDQKRFWSKTTSGRTVRVTSGDGVHQIVILNVVFLSIVDWGIFNVYIEDYVA